jgi:hypothetical protein
MTALAQAFKIIAIVAGLQVAGYAEGGGAYYHNASMGQVCERRVGNGWTNGQALHCSWPCLAACGAYDPTMLGAYVLADLPGGGRRI